MISDLRSMDQAYADQFAQPRAAAALALAFAVVAVAAAAGGLFSVLTYAVGRRRREFGIRTAMGAQPAQIWRLVFKDGAQIAATGLVLGTAAAWLLSRALVALTFGVTIFDPVTWLTVMGVIACATLLAAWRPAVQAMRADPLSLLRDE
jgi:ABC-type antimicrobial peptide transport system permease subunit